MVADFVDGEVTALVKRGIREETARKWDYRVGLFKGKHVQIANYRDASGAVVAQKLRFANKDFTVTGDLKKAGLYGQHLWRDKGKMLVVVEGEIDALTVSQLQQNKWPVVSVPNGADGARKAFANNLEYLLGFDHVIIMFDVDKMKTKPDGTTYYPGQDAAKECAEILPPGRAKIATLPMKDPNEMLQAGRGAEVVEAIWGAKVYRPDGVVSLSDIRKEVVKVPEKGLPWCFPALTKLTYGRRYGEVYAVGAGTGVGKTDVLTQQIAFDVIELDQKVGVIFLEQQPAETGKRIAGKVARKRFHVPDAGWVQGELEAALDKLDLHDSIRFYDHFGQCDWDVIEARIRFMYHSEGIKLFYLDHLTALATGLADESEKDALERIMGRIGSLVKELKIIIILVSHLTTPEGKPHEEGGRVTVRQFKGSRAIGFWCHFMFGLERDQQAEDPEERRKITFRVVKDRFTGQATGEVFYLGYNVDEGTLYETEAGSSGGGVDDCPF